MDRIESETDRVREGGGDRKGQADQLTTAIAIESRSSRSRVAVVRKRGRRESFDKSELLDRPMTPPFFFFPSLCAAGPSLFLARAQPVFGPHTSCRRKAKLAQLLRFSRSFLLTRSSFSIAKAGPCGPLEENEKNNRRSKRLWTVCEGQPSSSDDVELTSFILRAVRVCARREKGSPVQYVRADQGWTSPCFLNPRHGGRAI